MSETHRDVCDKDKKVTHEISVLSSAWKVFQELISLFLVRLQLVRGQMWINAVWFRNRGEKSSGHMPAPSKLHFPNYCRSIHCFLLHGEELVPKISHLSSFSLSLQQSPLVIQPERKSGCFQDGRSKMEKCVSVLILEKDKLITR